MRLGALMLLAAGLSGGSLAAQAPPLPWMEALLPSWTAATEGPLAVPPAPPAALAGQDRILTLSLDGRLRVVDRKGGIHLSAGLPGRPRKVWRDGGIPLEPTGRWAFPERTPLGDRKWSQFLASADPRALLGGLLWVLDDGEQRLTVVHPATARVLFLRVPEGASPDLRFFPDRLELRAQTPSGPRAWTLSWIALLPHLVRLTPTGRTAPKGTALQPFPKES